MDGLGFVFMTTWRSCVCMRHSKEQTCFECTIMSCWCREHGIFQHQMTTILLMEEILHRLRLVVYPIICKVIYIYIPGGCLWFLPISDICSQVLPRELRGSRPAGGFLVHCDAGSTLGAMMGTSKGSVKQVCETGGVKQVVWKVEILNDQNFSENKLRIDIKILWIWGGLYHLGFQQWHLQWVAMSVSFSSGDSPTFEDEGFPSKICGCKPATGCLHIGRWPKFTKIPRL